MIEDMWLIQHQEQQYKETMKEITSYVTPEHAENYYPIFSAPLTRHSGIEVSGTFETDNDSTVPRLAYVTVLHDPNSLDPANGYGFAWMVGDGNTYNVYLVDNSALANDLFINESNIISPQGENTWRAAGRMVITANVAYSFKLSINDDFSTTLKIWQANLTEPTILTPTNSLHVGAPTSIAATGEYLALGVMGTQNSQWWYDNLQVTTLSGVHTAVLFRLKARAENFPDNSNVKVNYYGYGIDGISSYGASAYLRTKVGGVSNWTLMGTNTSQAADTIASKKISEQINIGSVGGTYLESDRFIDLLVTSTYASTLVTDVTTHYVNLETALPEGIHTGGCADIYVNDSSKIVMADRTINNVTNTVSLSTSNGFYGPLHSIVRVEFARLNDTFEPNVDWVLVTPDISTSFSLNEEPYIKFNTSLSNYKVRVTYRYYQDGANIQNLLDSDAYRYSGVSNLLKIMPPTIVTINKLDYKGTISVANVQKLLKEFINNVTDTLTVADILNVIYKAGAFFIDATTLDITISATNYLRESLPATSLVTSYTKSTLTNFFTDEQELSGVTRL